ncbi:MAG TPA: low molecular weight protein-tyrosine-phosphatase [Streptosporangiaceae bacterium]|nr:low molecular weight protein-tyrosine-phosphatase [Streptosporangiaceae bacterium]
MPYIVAGDRLRNRIGHAGAMVREISAAGTLPQARNPQLPYRICIVCLGNICRSPMGEVLLRDELRKAGLAGKVEVESAGTGDWHIGEAMDSRARAELSRRGYDGSRHEARQIQASWLTEYDLLLAMDRANLASLRRMAAGDTDLAGRIQLMLSFDPDAPDGAEVPDPYNGSPDDYAEVFELVEAAARGLASQLAARF